MAKTGGLENSKTLWSENADEVIEDGDLREVFEELDVDGDKSLDYFEVSDDHCLYHCKTFPRQNITTVTAQKFKYTVIFYLNATLCLPMFIRLILLKDSMIQK